MDGPRPTGWGTPPYGIYLVLELLPAAILLTGMLGMARRRRQILAARPRPPGGGRRCLLAKRLVRKPQRPPLAGPGPVGALQLLHEHAKPGAWGGTIALLAGVGILLVGLCVLFLWGGFWRLLGVHHLGAGGGVCLSLRHGGGPQDIRSVTLLEALPEDEYVRTNGLDDGRRLIGHFRGRETGPL